MRTDGSQFACRKPGVQAFRRGPPACRTRDGPGLSLYDSGTLIQEHPQGSPSCARLLSLALLGLGAATPAGAIDLDLSINAPGVSLYIGDRDRSGRYWDGGQWRNEAWWRDNCHRYEGRKNFRGHCGPRGGKRHGHHDDDHGHCPPGQARKGRC